MVLVFAFSLIFVGFFLMVTCTVAFFPLEDLTVILAEPVFLAVTFPLEFTVIFLLEAE